jgi:hypothetical protein
MASTCAFTVPLAKLQKGSALGRRGPVPILATLGEAIEMSRDEYSASTRNTVRLRCSAFPFRPVARTSSRRRQPATLRRGKKTGFRNTGFSPGFSLCFSCVTDFSLSACALCHFFKRPKNEWHLWLVTCGPADAAAESFAGQNLARRKAVALSLPGRLSPVEHDSPQTPGIPTSPWI